MGINYDDYEGSKVDNIPTTTFVCGKCGIEMMEVQRKSSVCPSCGKAGWLIKFQCPECGENVESFRQDMSSPPFCYCNN